MRLPSEGEPNPNLYDLVRVEREGEGFPIEARYQALQRTPLYAQAGEQWWWRYNRDPRRFEQGDDPIFQPTPGGYAEFQGITVNPQLIDVLVQDLWDPSHTAQRFRHVEEHFFGKPGTFQWKQLSLVGEQRSSDADINTELWAIIVLARIDPDQAAWRYERAASYAINPDDQLWRFYFRRNSKNEKFPAGSATQMLGVLALATINPAAAKQSLARLQDYKPTRHETATGLWHFPKTSADAKPMYWDDASLRSIWFQLQFGNRGRARRAFEQLKASVIYQPELGLWRSVHQPSINRKKYSYMYYSEPQLLSLLIEHELAQDELIPPSDQPPPHVVKYAQPLRD